MIKLDNINVSFNDKNVYQHNVNVEIQSGEFVCIVGRSGAGKTVLLNTILGKQLPTVGAAFINGNKVTRPSKIVSVVYQDHCILPWMTLRKNILLGQPDEKAPKVDNIANMLHILPYLDMYPKSVSIGTRQRAAIARSLLADTDIIVMDEPLSSVDEITASHIRLDIAKFCKDKTTIYVTHNLNEALQLATRIIVIGTTGVVADLSRQQINDVDTLLNLCSL